MTTSEPDLTHPDSEKVAAYLDGVLSPEVAASVEAHLAECTQCRTELAEVRTAIRARLRRRRLLLAAPALAAATVVLVAVWSPEGGTPSSPGVLRSDAAAAAIEVVSPPAEAAVPAGQLTFRWRAPPVPGRSVRYVLALTDARGTLLWSTETGDTVAALPDSVLLRPNQNYLWYVDARLPGARSATSGVKEFHTSP